MAVLTPATLILQPVGREKRAGRLCSLISFRMAHRFAHITSIHTHWAEFSLLTISRCKKSCNTGSLITPHQLLMSLWDNHGSHILGPILERLVFIFLGDISALSDPSSEFCKNKDITSTNFLRLMISRNLILFSRGRNNKAGLCSTGLPS